MSIVVLSVFEGGYQPVTALTAVTALGRAGHDVRFHDLYVEGPECTDSLAEDDVLAIPIPLFDSLQSAVKLVADLRQRGRKNPVVFFGQHSTINARRLVGRHCDYAIVGEWEQPIVNLANNLLGLKSDPLFAVVDPDTVRRDIPVPTHLPRTDFVLPNRDVSPGLEKYPQPHLDKLLGEKRVVGGVETTRGCHHKCTYCSVYAAYDGKVLLSKLDLVMEDVRKLVDQGMEHLTFIDADFFNAKRYAKKVIESLHGEFPRLTYDLTTRVDHILENRDCLKDMARMNVKVITSALEFPSQRVLDEVFKEMTVPMIEEAIQVVRDCGIRLNPTFIMFNPWITLEDIYKFHDFIDKNKLEDVVDPIQYETRLHLYKGSPLLNNPSIRSLTMTEREFDYDWSHPDPRVDEVFLASVTPVDQSSGFKRCCLKC